MLRFRLSKQRHQRRIIINIIKSCLSKYFPLLQSVNYKGRLTLNFNSQIRRDHRVYESNERTTEKSPLIGGEGNWFAFLTEFDAPEGDFGACVMLSSDSIQS